MQEQMMQVPATFSSFLQVLLSVSIYLAMKTPNVTVKALLSVHGNVEEAQAKGGRILVK